ncbi:amidohydrolase family protein [Cyclobacterium plantarum]|uniref:Amidohydrolase family protein n=1 Tax=Cyclobacterium plantarum TaxID=2716263 RepID=A0ABX0H1V5_9BACT|nr:amidohydrolase family protein [Cyclobacterium plantarum]NHE55422.1 amidohydrolase family protein [Cyclobacterium plantarum]
MNKRAFIRKGILASATLAVGPSSLFSFEGARSFSSHIPVVDTHLHLWDLSEMDYPWLKGKGLPLEKNYSLADYRKATKGFPVSKMVFVECGRAPEQYLQEVDWVQGLSGKNPEIAGMVAYFPLEKGAAAQEDMEKMAERNIVRGIRKSFMPGNSGYFQGIALMKNFHWVCEVNIGHEQLGDFLDMVKKFPEQVFILDHMVNPDIRNQDWNTWEKALMPFASQDRVYCKVSGILTRTSWNWELPDIQPYFDTVMEVFGPDRIMYGGDWPVLLRAETLHRWITSFYALSKALSMEEKRKLFHSNAELVYRI